MSDLHLGEWVVYTGYIARQHDGSRHFWQEVPCPETRGVVVGRRTLSNGDSVRESDDWSGYDFTVGYTVSEFFTAYLISFDMRRKPLFVLPERIERADQ